MAKHNYKADTKIQFNLSIGFNGAAHQDSETIECWTGLIDSDLEGMTKGAVEEALERSANEWAFERVDYSWSPDDENEELRLKCQRSGLCCITMPVVIPV